MNEPMLACYPKMVKSLKNNMAPSCCLYLTQSAQSGYKGNDGSASSLNSHSMIQK